MKLMAVMVLGFIAFGIIMLVIMMSMAMKTLPDHNKLASYQPAVSSKVYSSDGKQIGLFARENRNYVPLEKIPNHVIAAFMAAEDKDFYSHKGVDPMGIARAIINNIASVGEGRRMQGASCLLYTSRCV